jgi:hypothetical protein
VIAYRVCSSAEQNEQHGPPLDGPSCSPPVQSSSYLTVGTLDANQNPAGFIGQVRYDSVGEAPIDPNNGDQSDVTL